MRKLLDKCDYESTISYALTLTGTYNEPVIFNCYWCGNLSKKHLYSIVSCYYFNVHNNKHKIILWLENNEPNKYNEEIGKYAELKSFSVMNEIDDTFLTNEQIVSKENITFYSDFVRCILLYKNGGVWFDLDCFFLRDFDPLLRKVEKELCVYEWETQNYPNNAIMISLEKRSDKMRNMMQYIINRGEGWGFQQAMLTYDLPIDMIVLPCSWFDPDWIRNSCNVGFEQFFKHQKCEYTFDNFFHGSFCYHWHNKWNIEIENDSVMKQLITIIETNLRNDNM